jgi:hypothetical protein
MRNDYAISFDIYTYIYITTVVVYRTLLYPPSAGARAQERARLEAQAGLCEILLKNIPY